MKKYITFGTKNISKELFKEIVPFNAKPYGGLWFTEYTDINANEWLMFLEEHPSIFYIKFNGKASIVTFNDDAKILEINTIEKFNNIYNLYPSPFYDKKILDYNKISEEYDAIYISSAIINKVGYEEYCISSLVLFRCEAIKSYTPIDVEYYKDEYYIEYEIKKYEEEKTINLNECEDFNLLYEKLKNDFFSSFNINLFNNFEINTYFSTLINLVNNYVNSFANIYKYEITKLLKHENFYDKRYDDILNTFAHKLYVEVFKLIKPYERKR